MMLLSTYRLQPMKFSEIRNKLDYFVELGVTHLYLSPVLKARPGSTHGYDVVDYSAINDELGGEEEYIRLIDEAKSKGLGIIQDIVPNHMAVHHTNWRLMDVLKKGRNSRYYNYFDFYEEEEKIRIPTLGDRNFKITYVNDEPYLDYYGNLFPINDEGKKYLNDIEKLLKVQYYELVDWRDYPSYRRFFAVNELIAVRQELEWVFEDSHLKILSFEVDGYRIDHIDGLFKPEEYLRRLKNKIGNKYIFIEKILSVDEKLRWDFIDGTTGYDFLNYSNLLFTDNEDKMTVIYKNILNIDLDKLVKETKKKIIDALFKHDIERISKMLGVDYEEIKEFLSCLKVYRTYITENDFRDEEIIRNCSQKVYESMKKNVTAFMKLQQYMPAVFAKAYEDTVLFIYNRLISLNEVSSDLHYYSISCDKFHEFNLKRVGTLSFNATSTHDTKFSEDVRMRISAISEIPDEWAKKVNEWHNILNPNIDKNDEYRLYQTIVGSFDGFNNEYKERLKAHMIKALREAKVHTDWVNVNTEYEKKMTYLIDKMFNNEKFMESFLEFESKIDKMGKVKSLSLVALKITSPGIADFYQGLENFRYLLTDPDNRRPVVFSELPKRYEEGLFNNGKIKAYVTKVLLNLRKSMKDFFINSEYKPLKLHKGLCGFMRGDKVLVIVKTLNRDYDIEIDGEYTDVITDETVRGRVKVDKLPLILVK
ncbi:malto-oligosyltrehalose synthase [Sulfurisphaera ohwakuensis]|uniref:(1->4)-alpha-D-glucan 1-alpha-D-glucosylmutase n=2 Tax=Sulfurisphaera ohwakuensis TaxID=69656 RepID=A0A7J9RQ73_SULOH|nr:malto-oligosyltrehalose synthase [Sulfurisphaera ohwakuensis]MBB5252676.1 (1->4)-alpha-D-glucan 1-alpha-D-glucosylmutase [Sulfurisphaera ohwakuensis]